jgi:SAM-dependent methyltransferase
VTAPAALGARLRAAGLTPRMLRAWAGTDRAAALHARYAERLRPPGGAPAPGDLPTAYGTRADRVAPAEAALALFVAGAEVPADRVRLPLDELIAAGLVERAGDRVRATLALLPVGESLVACDRLDAPVERELACWPDDSSHHLASALPPGKRASWLDLGCGSAFAQLARPELADALVGLDANPRAAARARLGAALSGLDRLTVVDGDLAAGVPAGAHELVTCNAPMPTGDATLWRRADEGFFPALFAAVPRLLAPGGLAVLHLARAMLRLWADDLPGETVEVAYASSFAVVWWRPGAAQRYVSATRELTVEHPHLTWRDRDDALARA